MAIGSICTDSTVAQRGQVMAAFKGGNTFTRQQLVQEAGMDINCVCGRVNALLAKGALEVCGVTYADGTRKQREVLRVVQ